MKNKKNYQNIIIIFFLKKRSFKWIINQVLRIIRFHFPLILNEIKLSSLLNLKSIKPARPKSNLIIN